MKMTELSDPMDRLAEVDIEMTVESSTFCVENTLESSQEDNGEVYENDAYRFFCSPFFEQELDISRDSSKTDSDFIRDESPLIPGVIEYAEVEPKCLYVPLDSAVKFEDILPKGMKPRFLKEEGMYVCERIQIARKMYDKMSHRLLNQTKSWFGKDGCLNMLPSPLKKYWQAKIDFPFPSISAGLTTQCIKPVLTGSGPGTKPANNCWELNLHLIGLHFTHHPLFNREHVLANKLLELHENFQSRDSISKTTHLQEKLKALKKSKKEMDTQNHASALRVKALNSQIRVAQRKLQVIKEEDALLLQNILAIWQSLKDLRARNRCVSTSVKLQFQRVEPKLSTSDGTSIHTVREGIPSDSIAGSSITEEDDGSIFVDNDIVFHQNLMGEGFQDVFNVHNSKEKAGDLHHTVHRRMSYFPYVPVLRMNELITSDKDCERLEYYRRTAVHNRKISIKIFYSGKLVSTTSQSPFDHDFRVKVEETFNMQVTNWPESLMLEVHEHKKFCSTLLAKVYLPISHRNMTSTSAPVETSQFICDQLVRGYYTGVGSNVFFKMDDNDTVHMCLLTTAKLYYVLSWAEDEWGLSKAPPADPVLPSFSSLAAQLSRRQLEWLKTLRFDPNHPANTGLVELLREVHDMQENSNSRFQLDPVEEYFVTDEQLDSSKRFGLLRLRNQCTLQTFPSRPIPLHEWEISQDMIEDYRGPQDELCRATDTITLQRKWAIRYFQKLVRNVQTHLLHMNKKYKLSDIVRENWHLSFLGMLNWIRGESSRPLKPRRQNKPRVPPGSLIDGDLMIRVNIQRAANLPIRHEINHVMENRGTYCGLSIGPPFSVCWKHSDDLQDQLQPFAEVSFQGSSFRTSTAEGPNPVWGEEFCLDFSSLNGDYSHAGLAKVQDDIIINIFDEVSSQHTKRDILRGCGTHAYLGRQWLGSVNIPFSTLLRESKISCILKINMPRALLGYSWSRNDERKDNSSPAKEKADSYLTVYIILDPPIPSEEYPPSLVAEMDSVQKQRLPSQEKESTLAEAQRFEMACRAEGKQKRFMCTAVNGEGQLVLATKFIKPVAPPPEVLHLDEEEDGSNLVFLRRVAAFVSLIPVLPSSSEVGDYGEMWLASEECLRLVIGNNVSLAILLCNFFLHLKVQAWVLLGTSLLEGETAYVLTTGPSGHLVWNPKDGKHHSLHEALCPIIRVDCLVNWQNVWFNKRGTSALPHQFKLSDKSLWIALFSENPQPEPHESPAIQYLLPQSELAEVIQRRLGDRLKQNFMEWRCPHPTRWNRRCPALLSEILAKFEMQTDSSDMALELCNLSTQMSDVKVTGMVIRMAFTNMDAMIEQVQRTQIHCTEIPGTEFALSVYIHPYPNDILSVWIFLATLVKCQHGTYYLPPMLRGEQTVIPTLDVPVGLQ